MRSIGVCALIIVSVAACSEKNSGVAQQGNSGAESGATATGATGTGTGATGTGTGTGSTLGGGTGTTAGGAAASGTSSGLAGSGSTSMTTAGSMSGATASGTTTMASSGSASGSSTGATTGTSGGGVNVDAGLPPGAPNMVPATYMGKPFAQSAQGMLVQAQPNIIPGFIYIANYDTGGAGVAFCHSTTGAMTAAGCMGGDLNDWCCGNIKGCNEATQPATSPTACPPYRTPTSDNAGLSHMNMGEPDCYASTGPTWQFVAGSNGPTLDGPMVTAGTPVPMDAHTTTVQDTYLSYTYTGEWLKFTVEVLEGGTYSIGGLMGVPAGTQLTIDFGSMATSTGVFTPPKSPCMWVDDAGQGCPETYHSWENVANLATVSIPAAGTYLMTFTIVQGTINPLFFTFTKM